ncbi:MAG: hypothetical protein WBF31_16255, partial [Anaerolineae bacterium]
PGRVNATASKSSVGSYVYGASSPGNCQAGTQTTKPHAVQQAGSNVYSYDCNGNMTGRTVGGVAYTLVYDAENRVQQVKQGSTVLASYTYDADGNRVKAVIGSDTTGGFLPRMPRIDTKAEARFVQISEIRGRESGADFRPRIARIETKGSWNS